MIDVPKHKSHAETIHMGYGHNCFSTRFKRNFTNRMLEAKFSREEIDNLMNDALRRHNRGQSLKVIVASFIADRLA
jgi:hypothetical protein